MSSDDYFDDELDSAFLKEVDAIEAAHTHQIQSAPSRTQVAPAVREVIELDDDSDEYDTFAIDEADIRAIDLACSNATSSSRRTLNSTLSPRKGTMGTVQTTLFGGVAPQKPTSKAGSSSNLRPPDSDRDRPRPKKTKQWDHTAFAKTGWKKPKPKSKGKERALFDEGVGSEEEWDSPTEFEQFPAPNSSTGPPPLMKLSPDLLSIKQWLYPLNQPKRDYQFNIVKRCLFDNTLVALPTGLGKTFIAGVVMLNYYTWFPEGKVVFVAPTKPLVAQQIDACHKTCGIPGSHAAELTGQNSKASRATAWQEKRVFYMTPQTLMNDLRTNNCDPGDIVLLVIDEAHKGTGDYAYAQVIRYMMAKNPHFRVLALTATPGSKPDAVQEIVDALHISRIEIRDERSLDLVSYMHQKNIQQHYIDMTSDYQKVIDFLVPLMDPMIKRMVGPGILQGHPTPTTLHPFSCLSAISAVHGRRDKPLWALGDLSSLSALSRAMGYLIEHSMSMCYSTLRDLITDKGTSSKKLKSQKKLLENPHLQAALRELEQHKNVGFPPHPKMERLKALLVDHFGNEMISRDENTSNEPVAESRAMVFAAFRETVDEIVDTLNQENPMIRASRFVGQGVDKQGRKGYAQKEQLEVIRKFKKGDYNVLVSTSIGEEGLDIGEVDMIVCYDAQKAPIRMLQRVGRTGRKRDGTVHVLLAVGREEKNWDKAVEAYRTVQTFIVKAEQLELYDDVDRMIPANIKPQCTELVMNIEEYVREEPKPKKGSPKASAKGRNQTKSRDVGRNIPPGALTTFISARKLKPKKRPEFDPTACESDDSDKDLEAGIFGPRRTVSLTTKQPKKTKKPRRAITIAGTSRKSVTKPSKTSRELKGKTSKITGSSLLDALAASGDDSDDEEIEAGLFGTRIRPLSPTRTPPRKSNTFTSTPKTPSEVPFTDDIIDLVTPSTNSRKIKTPLFLPASSLGRSPSPLSVPLRLGSPCRVKKPSPSPSRSSIKGHSDDAGAETDDDMAWLVAGDSEPDLITCPPSPDDGLLLSRFFNTDGKDDLEVVEDSELEPTVSRASSPVRATTPSVDDRMPPPALPARFSAASPDTSLDLMPEPSFAVRIPGKHPRKRVLPVGSDSSPAMPPLSQRRLQRHQSPPSPIMAPPPPKRRKRVFKDTTEAQKNNPWIDVEATHSGDERGLGSSDVDQMESESDLRFVEELPATQASPSYDQTAVYRQSLLTQMPGRSPRGPVFRQQPVRRGGPRWFNSNQRAGRNLSSPTRIETGSDDYWVGSFVVDDDADISFTDDT